MNSRSDRKQVDVKQRDLSRLRSRISLSHGEGNYLVKLAVGGMNGPGKLESQCPR